MGRKEIGGISQGWGKPWKAQSRWACFCIGPPRASPSTRHPMLHLMHLFNECIGESSDGAVVNEVVRLTALLIAVGRICYGRNLRTTYTYSFYCTIESIILFMLIFLHL